MIKLYILLFMLTAFILLACAVYIGTKHTIKHSKLAISIIQLFVLAIITSLAYTHAIAVKDPKLSEVGYIVYFCGIDWILITFLFYARQYTKVWLDNYAAPLITNTIAVLDNISLITNLKWHHAFTLREKRIALYDWFFAFDIHDYYYVHLIFCYILVAMIIVVLLKKTLQTSGFHRT